MKIYFSGIGGIGISGLAQFCLKQGHEILGSEPSPNAQTQYLQNLGAEIFETQVTENLPEDLDLFVYTEAVSETNPERQEATRRNLKQRSYFEYLGEVTSQMNLIAVAGSHGKTTTTGLIAAGFKACGFDASVFIGSTLPELDHQNFYAGSNDWCVIEACEYRNNFRFLEPNIVILTNLEYDHPDAFPTEESYFQAFKDFCGKADKIIDQPTHQNLSLKLMGQHNQENASLALALAEHLELDLEKFKAGMAQFTGAGRRQEFLGEINDIKIYDDYGHHPTEINATLAGFRERFPESKIALIYEPHQFCRSHMFFDAFCQSLSQADFLGLYPIYEARDSEEDKAAVSIQKFQENIQNSQIIKNISDVQAFSQQLSPGDILLFMGAGVITHLANNVTSQKISPR